MNPTNLKTNTLPGEPIQDQPTITNLNSGISFAFNSTSAKPLSPLVQASFNSGALQISAVVFVASSESPSFSVNQQSVISDSGDPQLDFFIIYDAPEVGSQTFNAYRVDFVIANPPAGLAQIETFLWDSDPITSRGTITEVERT